MRIIGYIDRLSPKLRRVMIAVFDLVTALATFYLSFFIRFDGTVPSSYAVLMWKTVPLVLVTRIVFFHKTGLYRGIWRYASIEDLMAVFRAVSLSSMAIIVAILFFYGLWGFPRSVFVIDWLLLIVLIGGNRFIVRAARASKASVHSIGKRVLIFGAGDTGDALLRDLKRRPTEFNVVGLVDDNPAKVGRHIHGVPVLGKRKRLIALARENQVDEIYIAIPSASASLIRELVDQLRETGVTFRRVPAMRDLVDGRVTVQHLRQVELDDLLGREPVSLDLQSIGDYLHGRRVLVTGAGGSIGSELCRQILHFKPTHLIMLDQAESGLYHLGIDLDAQRETTPRCQVVCDVTDDARIEEIFAEYRPEVVFHAAAHKHVPMMELNKKEAVKNNVHGTRTLGETALRHGVEKFVMISTDKAVNPTSIMGASKRIAEMFLQSLAEIGRTRFITVRFGNVLGSDGSVVPLFKRQILAGGPLTVTHPNVFRYFMTISEAVQLVLQAGAMGDGGEIYILNMGEPVRILDLAKNLITLSGYRVEDLGIKFIGLRPGEKLNEELWVAEENIKPTEHEQIYVADGVSVPSSLSSRMDVLLEVLITGNDDDVIKAMQSMVPTYTPYVQRNLAALNAGRTSGITATHEPGNADQ